MAVLSWSKFPCVKLPLLIGEAEEAPYHATSNSIEIFKKEVGQKPAFAQYNGRNQASAKEELQPLRTHPNHPIFHGNFKKEKGL